jgi:recombination protein RecR
MFPPEIQNFINTFSKLPSIGPRMATRLAFYLTGLPKDSLTNIISALSGIVELGTCTHCFGVTESKKTICSICENNTRNKKIVAIVEKQTDMFTIEKAGGYQGIYLILGELKSDGVLEQEQKRKLELLKKRIETEHAGSIQEIIVALGPNAFSDFVTSVIKQAFKGMAERITRIGRGIPTGGQIEFSDEETLRSSFERRN